MTYPIPAEALDDRLAFVGTSGSGKTYAAGTAVERLLASGAKVVIVDPLDVWFGLRAKANGRDPAFPVVIFGGEHADLPLTENAGALIGEAVAGMAESAVVSLAGLGSKASERRFMLGFLERLYRRAPGEPFHLVFDEADLWAPQRSTEPQLQNLMENIVRRGRVKGFIPWLITQRPAVISKDILSQVDGLVAMKLTGQHDRDALKGWIEGQADRSDEKRMLARMAQLTRGEGIVWIPGRGVLKEATFPAKTTFDSSSTPKRGETKRTASLKPLDLGKLKGQIAAIEAERAKPKSTTGKAEPAAAPGNMHPAVTIMQPDPALLRDAEERGRARGFEEGRRVGATEGFQEALRQTRAALTAIQAPEASLAALPARAAPTPPKATTQALARVARERGANGDGLSGGAARLLEEVQARYPATFSWSQLAALTGRKARGGSWNTARKILLDGGYVHEVGSVVVPAVAEQRPPTSHAELLKVWIAALPAPADELLRVIAQHPDGLSLPDLAALTNRQPRGGSWNTAVSMLRSNGLIVERSKGHFILGTLSRDAA